MQPKENRTAKTYQRNLNAMCATRSPSMQRAARDLVQASIPAMTDCTMPDSLGMVALIEDHIRRNPRAVGLAFIQFLQGDPRWLFNLGEWAVMEHYNDAEA